MKFDIDDVIICTKEYGMFDVGDIYTIVNLNGENLFGDKGYSVEPHYVILFDAEDCWELYEEELPYQDELEHDKSFESFIKWLWDNTDLVDESIFKFMRLYKRFQEENNEN